MVKRGKLIFHVFYALISAELFHGFVSYGLSILLIYSINFILFIFTSIIGFKFGKVNFKYFIEY